MIRIEDRRTSTIGGLRVGLRSTPVGLVVLALLVGGGAGAGAVLFRYLILAFSYVFTGYRDYSGVGRASHGFLHGLGPWFVVAAPIVGGIVYGPLIYFFAREAAATACPR